MTILILANNDVGLYRFRRELIEALCRENEVFLALPEGKMVPELKKTGATYIPFPFRRRGMNPFADMGQFLRYVRLIRKIRPHVVLTYTIKPNVYGGLACRVTKTPYIGNVTGLGTAMANGGVLSFITSYLYTLGLKRARCVFFQNAAQRELFTQKQLVQGKNRLIPGSGVNLNDHRLTAYPPQDGVTRFLFVGRIMRDKGIEELLSAMRKLWQARPDIFLDIVGEYDEDYSQAIGLAQEEGFAKYHGLQLDVRPFYQAAHCIVLPSYHEGTSNVLLEASAIGRPVITTNVPGCRETFDEGITGFGCMPRDAGSLKEAMEKFLALPYEERAAMGRAGHEKMLREFDRNIVIGAYMEEIGKLK